MLNNNKDGLVIFDNFVVDRNLPKYKDKEEQTGFISIGSTSNGATVIRNSAFSVDSGTGISWFTGGTPSVVAGFEQEKPKENFFKKISKLFSKPKGPTITVEQFFKHINNNSSELKKIDDRLESYVAAIEQANKLGQTALSEKLTKNIDVVKYETQLFAVNLTRIITEEQVVRFCKECKKGLRLDWIKNFTRIIPSKFVELKNRLDELEIFDNYTILHFDSESKSYAKTQKEIDDEKDPILFGMIKDSRKLYYIGCWKDEYCDLTIEDFIDKFGKKAIDVNNITAEIKI